MAGEGTGLVPVARGVLVPLQPAIGSGVPVAGTSSGLPVLEKKHIKLDKGN